MSKVSGIIDVLTRSEMELLHSSALTVLSEVGMRIEHEEALKVLAGVGCKVDFEKQVVKFPSEIVENAVKRMRKDFLPRGEEQSPRYPNRIPMRYTSMHFSTMPRRVRQNFDVNTGGFTIFVYDLDGQRRPSTMQDARDSIRLADALGNIDLVGLPCVATEIPAPLRPVVMTAAVQVGCNGFAPPAAVADDCAHWPRCVHRPMRR